MIILDDTLKKDAEISGRWVAKDTAHLEISVSLVLAFQDIAANVNDRLCVAFVWVIPIHKFF